MSGYHVVLLLGCQGERGLWRFLIPENSNQGLVLPFSTDNHLEVSTNWLQEYLGAQKGPSVGDLRCMTTIEITPESALVVITCDNAPEMPGHGWQTLPDIVRNLPRDKSRVAYMKVFQFLASCHEETLEAIELTPSVIEALTKAPESN